MARVNKVEKSRKALRCSKCGKDLPVGSPYVWAKPRYGSKIIRCTKCGIKSYETSGSEYVQTVGALQDNWRNEYGCDESTIESISEALNELMDNAQCSLDNMPESLQYSPSGEMLQERIDCLESVISDLESLDIDDYKSEALESMETITVDKADFVEYYGEENVTIDDDEEDEDTITICLSDLPNCEDYDEVISLPFISDEDKEALEAKLEDTFAEAVNDVLGNLEC